MLVQILFPAEAPRQGKGKTQIPFPNLTLSPPAIHRFQKLGQIFLGGVCVCDHPLGDVEWGVVVGLKSSHNRF